MASDSDVERMIANLDDEQLDAAETEAQKELIDLSRELESSGDSISGDEIVDDSPEARKSKLMFDRLSELEEMLDRIRSHRRKRSEKSSP
jgi:Na+/phosphate symporter